MLEGDEVLCECYVLFVLYIEEFYCLYNVLVEVC